MNTDELHHRLANWRAHILHMLEARLSPDDFAFCRTVILKSLGDNGLKGDIKKLDKSKGEAKNEN
jgi:hypothetical protein